MEKTVIDITPKRVAAFKQKKVAAYARVSCGKDTMLHSLAAQIDYYKEIINANPEWAFVGVFADEAKTGTKEERAGFLELMSLCEKGEVDLILTKSVSRFARNTVTLLSRVRELRQLGVDVYFEEQNIHTIGADGELLLTLLASFAQAESLSCSDNVKWRVRKDFSEGKTCNFTMLGYEFDDGEVILKEEDVPLVRHIFDLYIQGNGFYKIANILNEEGYRTVKGNEWHGTTVRKILKNEKYAGDLLLQKSFVDNHITKKKCVNTGELPQYYVEDNHEAIIARADFDRVQERIQTRSAMAPKPGTITVFTSKIQCSGCGANYRRKTTATGIVWICGTFNHKGKKYCPTSKAIPEDTLKRITAEALGLTEFEDAVFAERVKQIIAFPGNVLQFLFTDGTVSEKVWKDRSRSESWTPEMREKARQNLIRRKENG